MPGLLALSAHGAVVLIADLPDGIGFTGGTGLVALDVVALQEDTITRDDFAGFDQGDVADNDVMDLDDRLDTTANDLDTALFLLLIQCLELALLLVVVDRPDTDLKGK